MPLMRTQVSNVANNILGASIILDFSWHDPQRYCPHPAMIGHTLEEWDEIEQECGSDLVAEFEARYGPVAEAGNESQTETETERRRRTMSDTADTCKQPLSQKLCNISNR